ncbi:fasciclin domain-containing protein [Sphingopyxis sp. R3-92]|uniref:fasciclin domain-containing protein n=1 Tax=Sphingopyxis sp. R3-92 TaxID=3158553 RepID=UPI003EE474DE
MSPAKLFATPLLALATLAPVYAQETAPVEATIGADVEDSADAVADVAGPAQPAPAEPSGIAAEIATASPELQKLATAMTTAGVSDKLGAGPFTLFAPTDQAFAAVPQSMTDWLMNPVNSESLAKVLSYHVVPGRVTAEDLYAKIKAGGGKATLTTVAGETLTFTEVQGNIKIDGTQGSSGFVTQPDVEQSSGMVHVINGVLMPTLG